MAEDKLNFDVEKARHSEARIRAELDMLDSITKKLEDAVNHTEKWWGGESRSVFMRHANAYLARKPEIADGINALADRLAAAIREKHAAETVHAAIVAKQT